MEIVLGYRTQQEVWGARPMPGVICSAQLDVFTVDFKHSFLMSMEAISFATCRTRFGKA